MLDSAESYLISFKESPEIEVFADAWICAYDKPGDSKERDVIAGDEISLAYSESETAADTWLIAIVGIAWKTRDERHDPVLAAGMLEDFLGKYGETHIGIIEELAHKWPRFRRLLGGVWQGKMAQKIWNRIQSVRGAAW